jgi:hypothetical protein
MADRYWVGGNNDWDTVSGSLWSATSGGPGGAGVPTASDNVFFDTPGTFVILISGGNANCLNFRASAGNITFNGTRVINVGGNFDFSGATFNTASTLLRFNLNMESGTCLITSGGNIFVREFVAGTSTSTAIFQLQDAFNSTGGTGTVEPFTFNGGTLDLNNKTFTCRRFVCTSAVARTIAFGTSTINCIYGGGSTTSPTFDNRTSTNLSVTGNAVVNITYTGATATSVYAGNLSEANAISFNFTGGTYPLNFLVSALGGLTAKSVNFTGFAGTWNARTVAMTLYGNITLSTGMTLAASTVALTLGATSGTQILTNNVRTFDQPLTQNGIGGTVLLADALAMGTRALTLTNGTFDGGGYSITGSAAITMITGSVTAKNINTARAITHTSGTLTFGANNTTGAYTFSAGTLDLAGYQLNPSTFTSNGTGVRTLAFGSGNITCTGSGGTLFNSTSSTNLTVTGTPVVNIPYSGAVATTIAAFPNTEAQSISFNIQAGTYALTMIDANRAYRNVNFTGFSGTLGALGSTGVKIYGSLTLSSTMTLTPIANTLTFAGTSAGNTITTAGKVIGYKLAFDGVGGSWILQDALTISGTSCNVRHYNGTLDLNGKTLTLAPETNSYYTDPGTKNITFNGGTIIATNDFNNATPTGFTTTAGTGVGKISIQKATGFAFTGGGSTYNCTISNDGAGALSISGNNAIQTLTTTVGNITLNGSNAITTITNAVQPVTFTFAIGTTQTITNWNVSGTAGNLVTVISSSIGTPATLSKASGTVSANYLSLRDSAATGGAAWYAGANSTNVSGNSGWIFQNAPTAGGAFFAIF